jgi:hypothetical protein
MTNPRKLVVADDLWNFAFLGAQYWTAWEQSEVEPLRSKFGNLAPACNQIICALTNPIPLNPAVTWLPGETS